jgi:hypothetical protein
MVRPAYPTGPLALSGQLAWVNRASKGRFNDRMVRSAVRHHRERGTDPAILVCAAVVWLSLSLDRSPDPLNQYWHLVDTVSAQVRSAYFRVDPSELMSG